MAPRRQLPTDSDVDAPNRLQSETRAEPDAAGAIGAEHGNASETGSGRERQVRPDVVALGREVIAQDRHLLDRLAAYDRGDEPGR